MCTGFYLFFMTMQKSYFLTCSIDIQYFESCIYTVYIYYTYTHTYTEQYIEFLFSTNLKHFM